MEMDIKTYSQMKKRWKRCMCLIKSGRPCCQSCLLSDVIGSMNLTPKVTARLSRASSVAATCSATQRCFSLVEENETGKVQAEAEKLVAYVAVCLFCFFLHNCSTC